MGLRGRNVGQQWSDRGAPNRSSASDGVSGRVVPPPLPRGYWNPTTELMPRPELEALQLARLQRMVAWAQARSPFWRRKLDAAKVTHEAIRRLDDIRRLPFLTKAELI